MSAVQVKKPIVTDHAILRYLERAHGLDTEYFRNHIAGLCASGVTHGAQAVIADNVKFVLIGPKVVTTMFRTNVIHSDQGKNP